MEEYGLTCEFPENNVNVDGLCGSCDRCLFGRVDVPSLSALTPFSFQGNRCRAVLLRFKLRSLTVEVFRVNLEQRGLGLHWWATRTHPTQKLVEAEVGLVLC